MRAVGLTRYLPVAEGGALLDVELEAPEPSPLDLVVRVHAVSVNPVDTKMRAPKLTIEATPRVLGWDAAGDVVAAGSAVQGFAIGDRVYYAGEITRPGCNSEFHAVDSRLVGHMPRSLDYARAAALPLTAITAWEALFERLKLSSEGAHRGQTILIVGAAGGVGSIAVQLAKQVAGLEVIATASRTESRDWVRGLGASHVIDHRQPLEVQLEAIVPGGMVDHILCLNSLQQHWDALCQVIAPQGTIVSIVESKVPLDVSVLITKSAGLVWEGMFTRALYSTPDIAEQGRILERVAELIDRGVLVSTATTTLSPINAEVLLRAHAQLESGTTIGKVVVHGWD